MRKGVARRIDVEAWDHVVVHVRHKGPEGVSVAADGGSVFHARRALSCLVDPEPGDRVLVARSTGAAEAYVLAVLERPGSAAVSLVCPGDAQLRAEGALSIVAAEASIAAPTFTLHSSTARLYAARLTTVLGTVEAVLDRVVQRAKQAFRVVEEIDHLRAGRVDYEAKETLSLHAENATVTAEGLVKVDGEQIQLG